MNTDTYFGPSFEITDWLAAHLSLSELHLLPKPILKVLAKMQGFVREVEWTRRNLAMAATVEDLKYLFKRFRYRCEVSLSDEEMYTLLEELERSGWPPKVGSYAHLW